MFKQNKKDNLSCDKCSERGWQGAGYICMVNYRSIPGRTTIYGIAPYSPAPDWCPKCKKNKEKDSVDSRYGETNKAVLVLTVPDNFACKDCPCYDCDDNFCNVIHDFIDDMPIHPECPLKRLPDKSNFYQPHVESQFHSGYLTGIYEVISRLEKEAH